MSNEGNPRPGPSGRTARRIVGAPASEGAPADPPADFAINAQVRQLLARRWVQTERLEVGTTDGVVVIKGNLDREPGSLTMSADPDARDRFVRKLRCELKSIPGVTEVVLEVHPMEGGTS